MSGGAKFGITICLLVLIILGFAIAERLGVTGTNFLFRGEIVEESTFATKQAQRDTRTIPSPNKSPKQKSETSQKKNSGKRNTNTERDLKRNENTEADTPTANKRKKSSSAKKTTAPIEPFPLAAFFEISRKPQTWPAFVRLTRSRSITITDPETGISMGRMDIPARTVVKIIKVNSNGTLDVFDRTGQRFQVDASGTNFSAAFTAAKTKPKKKPKKQPSKAVAKTQPQPKPKVQTRPVVSAPKKQDPRMSAFGTLVTDEEWDEAESED